jgi:hypothetical protein
MSPNVQACLNCGDLMNSKDIECRNCGATNTFLEKTPSYDWSAFREYRTRWFAQIRGLRKREKDDKLSLTDEEKKIIFKLIDSRRYNRDSYGTRK